LQQPMAIALIGGLITSTILTLIALPALYELTEGIHTRVSSSWTKRRGNVGAAVAPGSLAD